jgi:hypothetical protein
VQAHHEVHWRRRGAELEMAHQRIFALETAFLNCGSKQPPATTSGATKVLSIVRQCMHELREERDFAVDAARQVYGLVGARALSELQDPGEATQAGCSVREAEIALWQHTASLLPSNFAKLPLDAQRKASKPAAEFLSRHVRRCGLEHSGLGCAGKRPTSSVNCFQNVHNLCLTGHLVAENHVCVTCLSLTSTHI